MATRDILSPDLVHCVTSCGCAESAQQSFLSLATSPDLDWFFDCGSTLHLRSFCSVHSFSWWSPCSAVFSATCMDCLCLSCVKWKKPYSIQKFKKLCVSAFQQNKINILLYKLILLRGISKVSKKRLYWSFSDDISHFDSSSLLYMCPTKHKNRNNERQF
jgi:hypothetical protein